MKTALRVLLVFAGMMASSPAFSALSRPEGETAIGVMIGEPTGVTGKLWLDQDSAIDAGMGYSFGNFFTIHADYLWHFDLDFGVENEFTNRLRFYFGGGGGVRFSTKEAGKRKADDDSLVEFFIRIPGGAEWRPLDPPLGVFAEIAPGFKAIPSVGFIFQGSAGVRYYF